MRATHLPWRRDSASHKANRQSPDAPGGANPNLVRATTLQRAFDKAQSISALQDAILRLAARPRRRSITAIFCVAPDAGRSKSVMIDATGTFEGPDNGEVDLRHLARATGCRASC